jgi:hypothetical protein
MLDYDYHKQKLARFPHTAPGTKDRHAAMQRAMAGMISTLSRGKFDSQTISAAGSDC